MQHYLETIYAELEQCHTRFRLEVCAALGWSEATFYRRKSLNNLSPLQRFVMEKIAQVQLLRVLNTLRAYHDPRLNELTQFSKQIPSLHFIKPIPHRRRPKFEIPIQPDAWESVPEKSDPYTLLDGPITKND